MPVGTQYDRGVRIVLELFMRTLKRCFSSLVQTTRTWETEFLFWWKQKGKEKDRDIMTTGVGIDHVFQDEASHVEQRLSPVWLPLESEDEHIPRTGGKTRDGTCRCCTHPQCSTFRQKAWCERLFLIRLGCCVVGCTSHMSTPNCPLTTLEMVVRSGLSTRSYRDFTFDMVDGEKPRVNRVIMVLLEEGAPPITSEELQSWNNGGTCAVRMMRGTCCRFRVKEALNRFLRFYRNHSIEDSKYLCDDSLPCKLLAEALGIPYIMCLGGG